MSKHLEFVKSNSYRYNNIKDINFNFECLIFDTESCQKFKDDNSSAKVYGWGLGCTRSNQMIYGSTLNEFNECVVNLFNANIKNIVGKITKIKGKYPTTKYVKIPVAVHNLAWDFEFLKYNLIESGFNYQQGVIKEVFSKGGVYQTTYVEPKENTFHTTQDNNVIYGCEVFYPYSYEIVNKDGSKTKIGLCLDYFDSYKIIACSVEDFPKYVHNVEEMFYKMNGGYDYDLYREDNHIQTDLELRYQYNDIYMLRETIEQFYIDGLCGGVMPTIGKRTASSIAFAKLKEMTFGEDKTEQHYTSYFELDQTTKFELTRKRIEVESYTGGFTHANGKYVNKHLHGLGCSLDINSSYPSQMAYKKFPYGKPKKGEYGVAPNTTENELFLIEVGFDFVKPKRKEYDLAIFKIGALNSKVLTPITGEVSGQEYFSTNIFNGEVIQVFKHINGTRLKTNYNTVLTSTEFEFWQAHFDFGCFEIDEYGCEVETETLEFNGLAIGEVLIYKAEIGKFKGFVEYFTELKVSSKKNGNIPMSNQAKLFLNSASGKFGTRQDKSERDLIMDKNGVLIFTTENEITYEGKEFYRPYASFVTAYGRLQLWKAIIYACKVENFIYCDTDSIYCLRDVNTLIKDMNSIGETIDKTQLGKWDIETVFTEFKVLGQKKYMYKLKENQQVKLKCCGLPKDAQEIIAKQGFEEFYLGKEVEGKKQRKRVYGGCLLLDTKFQIKKIIF